MGLPERQAFLRSSFDDAGHLFLFQDDGPVIQLEAPEYSTPTVLENVFGVGDVSPDGSTLVTLNIPTECLVNSEFLAQAGCGRLTSHDATTGERIDLLTPLEAVPNRTGMNTIFSGHDRLFAVPTEGAATTVWDLATGDRVFTLPSGPALNTALTADGHLLYTGHLSGTFKMWDLGPTVGLDPLGDVGSGFAVGANTSTPAATIGALEAVDVVRSETQVFFFDLATGALVGQAVAGQRPITALADNRFLVTDSSDVGPYPWFVYDPITGERTPFAGCELDPGTGLCAGGSPPAFFWVSSQDHSELLRQGDGGFSLIDPTDGTVVGELEPATGFDFIAAFSETYVAGSAANALVVEDRASGEQLAFRSTAGNRFDISPDGSLAFFDLFDSILVLDFETMEIWDFPIQLGRIQGMAADAETRQLALGDENGIHVFDIDSGNPLLSIPIPFASEIHWLSSTKFAVGTQRGGWATASVSSQDLIASATAGVTRTFTPDECSTYRIDPCPTLEEIRTRPLPS